MGWNYLSIPKLQPCNHWSLGMDQTLFHPTSYNGRNYLSMLWLKLVHASKRGSWKHTSVRFEIISIQVFVFENIICIISTTLFRPGYFKSTEFSDNRLLTILIDTPNEGLQLLQWRPLVKGRHHCPQFVNRHVTIPVKVEHQKGLLKL